MLKELWVLWETMVARHCGGLGSVCLGCDAGGGAGGGAMVDDDVTVMTR